MIRLSLSCVWVWDCSGFEISLGPRKRPDLGSSVWTRRRSATFDRTTVSNRKLCERIRYWPDWIQVTLAGLHVPTWHNIKPVIISTRIRVHICFNHSRLCCIIFRYWGKLDFRTTSNLGKLDPDSLIFTWWSSRHYLETVYGVFKYFAVQY